MVTSERARARARGARVACPHNVRDGVQHHISAPDAGSGQSLQQLSAFQHWPGVHDDSAETDTLLLRALQQQLNDRGPREGQNDVAIGDFGQSKLFWTTAIYFSQAQIILVWFYLDFSGLIF